MPGSYSNISVDCVALPGGDMLVAGWTKDLGQPTDIVLVRVDADGEVVWYRVWDGPAGAYDNVFDLALVLGPKTSTSGGADDVALLKFGLDGTLLWDLVWSGPFGTGASMQHLVAREDGSIVIAGQAAPRVFGDADLAIARITASGVVDWTWTWDGDAAGREVMRGLVRDAAGGLAFAGETETLASGDDVVAGRLDADGVLQWLDVRTADDLYPWNDQCESLALDPEGRLVVNGYGTRALGSGAGGDGPPSEEGRWLLRYDPDGTLDAELFTPQGGFARAIDVAPSGTIYTAGTAYATNADGLLVRIDDLFVDCNANGVPDECDVADGTSLDCDADGIPDECLIANDPSADVDGSGVLDVCEAAGDLDGDGAVQLGDVLVVLSSWGDCVPGEACPADLDGDGVIGLLDLLQILAGWGG